MGSKIGSTSCQESLKENKEVFLLSDFSYAREMKSVEGKERGKGKSR